jgi:hypothetical protein
METNSDSLQAKITVIFNTPTNGEFSLKITDVAASLQLTHGEIEVAITSALNDLLHDRLPSNPEISGKYDQSDSVKILSLFQEVVNDIYAIVKDLTKDFLYEARVKLSHDYDDMSIEFRFSDYSDSEDDD